ncbi:MAG: sensor histidine kinase [Opitutaceae bacterium]
MNGSKNITSRRRHEAESPPKARQAPDITSAPDASTADHSDPELVRSREEVERLRARYFELFDFAPVAYFTFSTRGVIESVNVAATELLQVEPPRLVGLRAGQLFDGDSKAAFRVHLERVLQEPGKHAIDLVLNGVDGQRRHVHLVSRLIRNESGAPLCLSAAVDFTGRKVAEEEISRLNSALEQRVAQRTLELEESNKDLEAFIYSISHDLRAPLRNMAGFASIITEEYADQVPPEVRGFVKRILAGNEKMLHLVDDLLRFSRLGRKPLEVADTDLNELVEEALAELSSDMAGRDIQLHRQELPSAECDPGLMRQVFINFLSNALKYTRPRRPAIIKIACEVRDSERVIVIQDNGVGFDMRYADKLFGVFQRLHVPSEFEGNGVGLAMVSRILLRHNGRACADGRVGEGATFWFTFEGLGLAAGK